MSIILYPAVFREGKNKKEYWVEFPDLPGCTTQGDSFEQAYQHAQDVLGHYLASDTELDVSNQPSLVETVQDQFPNSTIMLVPYDFVAYAKKYKNKAVKKTLTIPEWLNDVAIKEGINFSQVLQEALISKLNL